MVKTRTKEDVSMSVYALLGGDPDHVAAQVACAAAVTKRLKSTLIGLAPMPDPANAAVYVAGPDMVMTGSAGITAIRKAQEASIATLNQVFDQACDAAGNWLKHTFHHETGDIAFRSADAAALARAMVLPHQSVETAHALNPAFEHLLMEARLPIILAPFATCPDETCMIAWDGSPQAARSIRLHLDLIGSYKKVIIAQNADKLRTAALAGGSTNPAALADFLHEQRNETDIVTLKGPLSESLIASAAEHQSGLIVMGAYGHSRLGELLFGGTSKSMLRRDDAPALALSH
jgi:nucleotide-binding universal stress UspA family protein